MQPREMSDEFKQLMYECRVYDNLHWGLCSICGAIDKTLLSTKDGELVCEECYNILATFDQLKEV